jgi:nucleotide-binding universal stress UspA family protein
MYKKILVPLDGSKRAEAILPHVEELAHKFNAEIFLFHVIEHHFPFASPHGFNYYDIEKISHEANLKEAKDYLVGLAGEFREKSIKVKWFIEERPIPVTQSILMAADRYGVDLIALASHGRSALSRVFYGSVAASLLHLVDRPLLLVRSNEN